MDRVNLNAKKINSSSTDENAHDAQNQIESDRAQKRTKKYGGETRESQKTG
jgi:hypothetical protein